MSSSSADKENCSVRIQSLQENLTAGFTNSGLRAIQAKTAGAAPSRAMTVRKPFASVNVSESDKRAASSSRDGYHGDGFKKPVVRPEGSSSLSGAVKKQSSVQTSGLARVNSGKSAGITQMSGKRVAGSDAVKRGGEERGSSGRVTPGSQSLTLTDSTAMDGTADVEQPAFPLTHIDEDDFDDLWPAMEHPETYLQSMLSWKSRLMTRSHSAQQLSDCVSPLKSPFLSDEAVAVSSQSSSSALDCEEDEPLKLCDVPLISLPEMSSAFDNLSDEFDDIHYFTDLI